MSHNMDDQEPDFFESTVYMHDLISDLFCHMKINLCSPADVIEYAIYQENESSPALDIHYDKSTERMEISGYEFVASCTLRVSESYLKNEIHKISVLDFIRRLEDFHIQITEKIIVSFKKDFDWDFIISNLNKSEDLLSILLDMRYAASKAINLY